MYGSRGPIFMESPRACAYPMHMHHYDKGKSHLSQTVADLFGPLTKNTNIKLSVDHIQVNIHLT